MIYHWALAKQIQHFYSTTFKIVEFAMLNGLGHPVEQCLIVFNIRTTKLYSGKLDDHEGLQWIC